MLKIRFKIPTLISFYFTIAFLIKTYNIQTTANQSNQNANKYKNTTFIAIRY